MQPMSSLPGIHLGTSAFTAAGWEGSFYPKDMKPADYFTYYATKFDTVEVDSTFYRAPSRSTVSGWNLKTPKGFLLAAKVPQIITHEKVLKDCEGDLKNFLSAMDAMSDKLGPLLFQFGYFNKKAFKSLDEFLAHLVPFLKRLPKGYKFAVETRNKNWLVPKFADVLRERGVALTLIEGLEDVSQLDELLAAPISQDAADHSEPPDEEYELADRMYAEDDRQRDAQERFAALTESTYVN
jgi:uncharacterized protein YecE (DUF72 family)